jgi:hypothetical protein
MNLRYVDPRDLDRLIRPDGTPVPANYDQHTVVAQIARGVFDNFQPGFYFVIAMTGIILVLAANTAFNGFPVLGSILAKDGFMPRQLGSRGDRLAYSNGILILAFMAIALIVAFDAEVTKLIQLYIVGVFVSFNLSQLGMIRHWTRHLKTETDPAARRRMIRSRAINTFGLGMTAIVLASGLGAWGFSWHAVAVRGGTALLATLLGLLGGAFTTPLLLPWLPFRAFSAKGALLGGLFGAGLAAAFWNVLGGLAGPAVAIGTTVVASYVAMNCTGASAITSPSGVEREMRAWLPWQIGGAALAVVLWLVSMVI